MKNNIFKALILAAAAISLASCSEWTEPEPVGFNYATLEGKNPDLYEAYYQSIRDYRKSEHKVVIAKFRNKATTPAGRAEHITCLPDSVDYIILQNPKVSEIIANEMKEVRSLKDQKILYQIEYKAIENDYKAYAEAWNDAHPTKEAEAGKETPSDPADTLVSLNTYVRTAVKAKIAYLSEYGYDGVNIVYSSKNPASFSEEGLAELKAAQAAFLDPIEEALAANEDAIVFFEGTPQFMLVDVKLVENADYLIVSATSAVNESELSYELSLVNRYGNIPNDRFIISVTTRSIEDPTLTDGTFSGTDRNGKDMTAIIGAAEWTAKATSGVVKAGIAVENAQNDYYNLHMIYYSIREAISIMNPSPIK
ncbi:MAG: glycoside hydrolase family 18 [Bacteroidales bacterium]|nr:glycoside hydrolase family 18 [Bacteroidales bacterium]MDY6001967.1 glycoside hydrolase family 18 [Candidatus Cryptobacteroides sp.]